jgi:hypothetical protein
MGEPERAPGIDIESRRLMTGDAQGSAHRNHAGNPCQELGLAISGHPGDPDDLARSDGKADVVQLRGGQRLDLQHLAPGGAALGRSRGGRRRPIISSARLLRIGCRGVDCGDDAAGAHDADPVGDREDLLQLMGHQQHRPPLAGEPAQHGEKPLALLRGTSVTVRPGGSGRR